VRARNVTRARRGYGDVLAESRGEQIFQAQGRAGGGVALARVMSFFYEWGVAVRRLE
jgi:hypothetical protein